MRNFTILLKKNFLEFVRTKKWIVYILTFSLIALLSTLTAKYLLLALASLLEAFGLEYTPTIADAYSEFIANMMEIGYLLIAIMFSTTLLKEKKSSTYYTLKSNGVKESEIVLAHYVSKLILITVSYLFSLIIFVVSSMLLFKQYTGYRGVVALTYLYLMLVFALTFALFISSFIKKNSHGYVIAIVSYFAFSILTSVPHIDIFTPLYSVTLASNVMYDLEHVVSDYLINAGSVIVSCALLLTCTIYLFKNKVDNKKIKSVKKNG